MPFFWTLFSGEPLLVSVSSGGYNEGLAGPAWPEPDWFSFPLFREVDKMPVDAYSPCPGGTGKKIKFCCHELVSDFEKIEKMLEGGQHQACLAHVQRLRQKSPDKECLLAIECLLWRALGQMEEGAPTVARFLQLHPNNPVALAESAMWAVYRDGGAAAMPLIQRAVAACAGEIHGRVYQAIGEVAAVLAAEGDYLAARALLMMQLALDRKDPRPQEMLVQLHSSPQVPLWVKDERKLSDIPEDAPWKEELKQIRAEASRAQWTKAADAMEALAGRVGNPPSILRDVALLRGWTADRPQATAALRKYALMDVPFEDAAEAEAVALTYVDAPLGDAQDVLSMEYPVSDVEQLQIALGGTPRVVQVPVDPELKNDEDQPPPKAVYVLLDRPAVRTAEGLTRQTIPSLLCQGLLYGKQTDREARFEVLGVLAHDLDAVKAFVAEIGGPALGTPVETTTDEKVSATQELLVHKWRLPTDTQREQVDQWAREATEEALLERWPRMPLGIFDGKSPQQAAADRALHPRLGGIVLLLEAWLERFGGQFDFNRLRKQLGLPLCEPIDPEKTPPDKVPLARLARVMTENLSDDDLISAFYRAAGFQANVALKRFAKALVERPSMEQRQEYLHALQLLVRIEEDSEQALAYLERGRKAAEATGKSSAPWDLEELAIRTRRMEVNHTQRLLSHLYNDHRQEPGVAEALQHFLMQIGAIHPDGTPAMPPMGPDDELPGPAAEPGKLWTPDGDRPAGEKSKLWTPGM